MTSIIEAKVHDATLLADLGRISFIESHGNSANAEDVNTYLNEKYSVEFFNDELKKPANVYHIISHNKQPAGYSKIIFNSTHPGIQKKNVTKMERLYLLKEFYDLQLGFQLFNFNLKLSKNYNQAGMWLFVWKENKRAVRFYKKVGFKVIGAYDFKLTPTHSKPNHHMFLEY